MYLQAELVDVRKSSSGDGQQFHYRVKPTNSNLNGSIVEIAVQIFFTFYQFLLGGFKKAYLCPYDALKSLILRLSKMFPLQLKAELVQAKHVGNGKTMYQYVCRESLPLSLNTLFWCSRVAIPTKLFEGEMDRENDKASISTDKETEEEGQGLNRTWNELPSPVSPTEKKNNDSSSPCRQENGDHDRHHFNLDSQSVTSTASLPVGKSKPTKESQKDLLRDRAITK